MFNKCADRSCQAQCLCSTGIKPHNSNPRCCFLSFSGTLNQIGQFSHITHDTNEQMVKETQCLVKTQYLGASTLQPKMVPKKVPVLRYLIASLNIPPKISDFESVTAN